MKAKIWVLATVLADENAPAMPVVFAEEAEARAKYDEMIRVEWDSVMDAGDGPYPGDQLLLGQRLAVRQDILGLSPLDQVR
jgi:hypothetical protein